MREPAARGLARRRHGLWQRLPLHVWPRTLDIDLTGSTRTPMTEWVTPEEHLAVLEAIPLHGAGPAGGVRRDDRCRRLRPDAVREQRGHGRRRRITVK
jgi:hypothetical protein